MMKKHLDISFKFKTSQTAYVRFGHKPDIPTKLSRTQNTQINSNFLSVSQTNVPELSAKI